MSAANLVACPNCHKLCAPHHVCPHCGHYEGEQIFVVKPKKKPRKRAAR
jgi:large subunit ribosomal protein L32